MKKYFFILIAGIFLIIGGYFYATHSEPEKMQNNSLGKNELQPVSEEIQTKEQPSVVEGKKEEKQEPQILAQENITKKIKQNVPFLVQAPFGDWKKSIFQNGCEEAAMIMAAEWTKGTLAISAEEAKNKIEKLTAFEDETLGYNTDTDVYDMQKIFKNYFSYQNVKAEENIRPEDIKNEIQKGNIVLVPTFGRSLGNPHYTSPGPVTHVLVIIGYDPKNKIFITNDSGTKYGKDYEYAEDVLFSAVWSYPSGPNLPDPPKGALKKTMLVVWLK